jgi:hypothetical protein
MQELADSKIFIKLGLRSRIEDGLTVMKGDIFWGVDSQSMDVVEDFWRWLLAFKILR